MSPVAKNVQRFYYIIKQGVSHLDNYNKFFINLIFVFAEIVIMVWFLINPVYIYTKGSIYNMSLQ